LADIQFSYSPYIYGIFVDLPSPLADLLADLLHIWITTSFITEVAIDHTVGYGPIIELGTIITSVSRGACRGIISSTNMHIAGMHFAAK
jgi:hypothetical protein